MATSGTQTPQTTTPISARSEPPGAGAIWYSLWPYLLIGVIIILRHPTPIVRPEFWAEDADEFFIGAINAGIKILFVPVMGYHFFISRLISYIATFFAVSHTPFIYASASLVLNSLATGYFSREGFSYIISRRSHRILVCGILAIGPGTSEVFYNLVNLSSPLTLLALLLLIEKPWPIAGLRIVVFFLLALSAGQVFLLMPLIFYLWRFTRRRIYYWLLLLQVPILMLNAIGSLAASSQTGLLNYLNGAVGPRLFLEQGFIRLLVIPVFGPDLASIFMATPDYIFWPALFGLSTIFLLICTKALDIDQHIFRLLFIAYLCTVATFLVIALTRSYAIGIIMRQSGITLCGNRYSYLPGQLALLLWLFLLFSHVKHPLKIRRCLYAAIALIAALNFSSRGWPYQRPDLAWPKTATSLQAFLDLRAKGYIRSEAVLSGVQIHPNYYHHSIMSIIFKPNGTIIARADK